MEPVQGADPRVRVIDGSGAMVQAARLLAAGLVVGLLLGSVPLRQWAEALPDGAAAARVQRAAAAWELAMEGAGLNGPYRALRARVRALEQAR